MKRKDLITFVEKNLMAFGFKQGQWLWQPRGCQLILLVNGQLKQVALKTSMTKTALIFQMGRLAGLCEAIGMVRSQNQSGPELKQHASRPNGRAHDGFGDLAQVAAMAA